MEGASGRTVASRRSQWSGGPSRGSGLILKGLGLDPAARPRVLGEGLYWNRGSVLRWAGPWRAPFSWSPESPLARKGCGILPGQSPSSLLGQGAD